MGGRNNLKGIFSSGDGSYSFELKSDGTGVIIYSDFIGDAEEFDHDVNVENLAREIEEAVEEEIALQAQQNALDDSEIQCIRLELTAERLEEVFREEINQTLEDGSFKHRRCRRDTCFAKNRCRNRDVRTRSN